MFVLSFGLIQSQYVWLAVINLALEVLYTFTISIHPQEAGPAVQGLKKAKRKEKMKAKKEKMKHRLQSLD
jgi:hypothetical protein